MCDVGQGLAVKRKRGIATALTLVAGPSEDGPAEPLSSQLGCLLLLFGGFDPIIG